MEKDGFFVEDIANDFETGIPLINLSLTVVGWLFIVSHGDDGILLSNWLQEPPSTGEIRITTIDVMDVSLDDNDSSDEMVLFSRAFTKVASIDILIAFFLRINRFWWIGFYFIRIWKILFHKNSPKYLYF